MFHFLSYFNFLSTFFILYLFYQIIVGPPFFCYLLFLFRLPTLFKKNKSWLIQLFIWFVLRKNVLLLYSICSEFNIKLNYRFAIVFESEHSFQKS